MFGAHKQIKMQPLRRPLPTRVQKVLGKLLRLKLVLIKIGLQLNYYGKTSNRREKKCNQADARESRQLKLRKKSGLVWFWFDL